MYPSFYSEYAYNDLCEVEVYGKCLIKRHVVTYLFYEVCIVFFKYPLQNIYILHTLTYRLLNVEKKTYYTEMANFFLHDKYKTKNIYMGFPLNSTGGQNFKTREKSLFQLHIFLLLYIHVIWKSIKQFFKDSNELYDLKSNIYNTM